MVWFATPFFKGIMVIKHYSLRKEYFKVSVIVQVKFVYIRLNTPASLAEPLRSLYSFASPRPITRLDMFSSLPQLVAPKGGCKE